MTDVELAIQPSPERWPLWASIGHVACQRVFWLCDVAGEPGAETTPFTNAAHDCPGDDDLEDVLDVTALVHALTSTFRIVEACLDRWTPALEEAIRPDDWAHPPKSRGEIISRVSAHDISHISEPNEALGTPACPDRPLGVTRVWHEAPRSPIVAAWLIRNVPRAGP